MTKLEDLKMDLFFIRTRMASMVDKTSLDYRVLECTENNTLFGINVLETGCVN